MSTAEAAPDCPETTDLERRVLAHERILQSLIAYMSETEPRFVDHLRDRFVEPMKMARHEHDYRNVDDYAEEFIRAVMLIGMAPPPADVCARTPRANPDLPMASDLRPERVQMTERNGIWVIKADGAFFGDFHTKAEALAAAALAKLSLR